MVVSSGGVKSPTCTETKLHQEVFQMCPAVQTDQAKNEMATQNSH